MVLVRVEFVGQRHEAVLGSRRHRGCHQHHGYAREAGAHTAPAGAGHVGVSLPRRGREPPPGYSDTAANCSSTRPSSSSSSP